MNKKCKTHGCINKIPYTDKSAYCTEHTYARPQPQTKYESHKFYTTTLWKKLSKAVRQQYPLCPKCNLATTDVVDHIYEIRYVYGMDYSLEINNVMALCHSCHNSKTTQIRKTLLLRSNNDDEIYPTQRTFEFLKQYVVSTEQLLHIKEIEKRLDEERKNKQQDSQSN